MWPAKITIKDREIIDRKLARGDEDLAMPQDCEGKPFPEYLQDMKVAKWQRKGDEGLVYF